MLYKNNLKYQEIPVLMYHRVVKNQLNNSIYNIFVTQHNLEQQIKYFIKRGYELVTFKDLAKKFIKKPMVLTFDDGYQDNYINLLPLLKKYSVKAVIFALTDVKYNMWDVKNAEPRADLMTAEELLECHNSGLIEIASHGLTHKHLPKLSDEELNKELTLSKNKLEQIIGEEIISFAYPYGDYSNREKVAVKKSGYKFGIATVKGKTFLKDDLFAIRRVHMFPNENKVSLWKKSSGYYLRYLKLKGK